MRKKDSNIFGIRLSNIESDEVKLKTWSQLTWVTIDLSHNWLESQLTWVTNDLSHNWLESQLTRVTIDSSHNWLESQLTWIFVFKNVLSYTSLPLHTDVLMAMERSNAFTQSIREIAIFSILVLTMCIVLLEKNSEYIVHIIHTISILNSVNWTRNKIVGLF